MPIGYSSFNIVFTGVVPLDARFQVVSSFLLSVHHSKAFCPDHHNGSFTPCSSTLASNLDA
ncbi:hypothetical protein ACFJIV_09405 [Mucilaginibacter sp. UC70_90]